jgi:D-beta-D-heptose 7-phosphate kinase/D-beta-D-heptose 1-phosphate adenosyltransferase
MQDLVERLEHLGRPRILLVGDFILDRYVYGDVERINPEAPVPVLKTVRSQAAVGGAGNVAAAAPAMGAQVACVGVIGNDAAGRELSRLLREAGARITGLARLDGRATSVKTRYVGLAQHRHQQQMLRVDEESPEPLDERAQAKLRSAVRDELAQADIVVLEDYNKGVLSDALTPQLIADAGAAGKGVLVDPAIVADYRRYRGATLLKPNRYEAALASGLHISDDASLAAAAQRLLEIADAQAVVISLDQEGMYLHPRGRPGRRIPHRRPRAVYDVTGAGDETLAVMAVAIASGWDYEQAIELANLAGGLEVEKFGFVPIRREELAAELRHLVGLRGSKLLFRQELAQELTRRRQRGETVVFTNGCFDLLHMGHVRYLRQARELGNCLVVAINSDDSVRRLKGPGRPVIGQEERGEMLGALECVDYVTIFDEDTPIPLLELLRPDILVKGGTTPQIVGQELVEDYGGKVRRLGVVEGSSTTQIINRVLNNSGGH